MTEEQQKPVIKITDHYLTEADIADKLQDYYDFLTKKNVEVHKDDKGFYYREETEI